MMDRYRPDQPPTCPKCGEQRPSVKFCDGKSISLKQVSHDGVSVLWPCKDVKTEHLDLTCNRCGYSWWMACADAGKYGGT